MGRRLGVVALVIAIIVGGFTAGGYLYAKWRLSKVTTLSTKGLVSQLGNKPFNILEMGSDSRKGLTGPAAAMTGANSGASGDSHSDVVKIMHIDPVAGTISEVSIPRDTVFTIIKNQVKFGKFNRINVNLYAGPSLVAQTITANLGIPIAHIAVVSFGGIINASQAIGGIKMNFPYPARDTMSGLTVPFPGCRPLTNLQALALVRSRHYEWYQNGQWISDVTSDYGRIWRQNQFIKSFILRAKALWNPLTINNLLSNLPQGVSLDRNFTLNDLVALALRFHNFNTNSLTSYTLATSPGPGGALGDVLYINQPAAQEQLVHVFGAQLTRPTNPPPNAQGQTPMPPVITVPKPVKPTTTTKTTKTTKHHGTPHPVTTTTTPVEGDQYFDPTPC
jgi:LCP family protein required for cell wall assembly